MKVIERQRNSGKTTILLYHMVVDSLAIYVARTEKQAKQTFQKSQELGLDLDESRFVGITCDKLESLWQHGYKLLVDDADYIIQYRPKLGFDLIAHADVITITSGKQE